MAMIGTFTKSEGSYVGTIRTMTINVKAKIVPNKEKTKDNAPDYRIYAGGAELGAAWRSKGNGENGKNFMRVELDDPSFTAPIRAAFIENQDDEKAALIWTRR